MEWIQIHDVLMKNTVYNIETVIVPVNALNVNNALAAAPIVDC